MNTLCCDVINMLYTYLTIDEIINMMSLNKSCITINNNTLHNIVLRDTLTKSDIKTFVNIKKHIYTVPKNSNIIQEYKRIQQNIDEYKSIIFNIPHNIHYTHNICENILNNICKYNKRYKTEYYQLIEYIIRYLTYNIQNPLFYNITPAYMMSIIYCTHRPDKKIDNIMCNLNKTLLMDTIHHIKDHDKLFKCEDCIVNM